MNDLVKRLRDIDERARWWPELCREAADRIEELTRELESYRKEMLLSDKEFEAAEQRIEELEAEDEISHALLEDAKQRIAELEAALRKIVEHYEDALAGDYTMGVCADYLAAIARSTIEGLKDD